MLQQNPHYHMVGNIQYKNSVKITSGTWNIGTLDNNHDLQESSKSALMACDEAYEDDLVLIARTMAGVQKKIKFGKVHMRVKA